MKPLLFVAAFLMICLNSFAQVSDTTKTSTQAPDPSLAGQFREIFSRSKTYNDHKLVRSSRLTTFYQSVTDSLKAVRKQLNEANAKLQTQGDSINNLSKDVTTREKNLADAQARVDEVNLLGIGMSKTNYQLVMWGLVLLLAIALFVSIARSAGVKREAADKIRSYDELTEEHRLYKAKAAEKEKKLARELQDERNKLEELQARKTK